MNFKRVNNSLANRLVFVAGSAVTLTLAGFIGLAGWSAAEKSREEILSLATEKAKSTTAQVSVQITDAVSASNALASTLSGFIKGGTAKRDDVAEAVKMVVQQYPNLHGSWLADTVDKRTAKYLPGTEFNNGNSLFTPWWVRQESGNIESSTFTVDSTKQWYQAAVTSGKSILIEPYVGEQGQVVTSIVAPLKIGSDVVGVAGVDIGLQRMSEMLGAMQPFDGGRVMMLSNAGKWIVPPQSDLLMKDYDGVGWQEIKSAIADQGMRVLTGSPDGALRLVYPFTAPGMNTTWAIVLDVPAKVFSQPIHARVLETILAGLTILAVVLGVIFASTKVLINKPLERSLKTIQALIERRYDVAIPDIDREDEIGRIGKALQIFRDKAKQADFLAGEQEVEQQRRLQRANLVDQLVKAFEQRAAGSLSIVTAAATELDATAHAMTQVADSTSKQAMASSAAAEETSANVQTVAAAAEEMVASLHEIERQVVRSNEVAGIATREAEATNDAMLSLGSAAEQIGAAVTTISAIAGQTNLLALNATIEAARAGEAGRGFAVVAAEVKELASQTARATDEIGGQIMAIQAATSRATGAIRQIGRTIEAVSEISAAIASTVTEQAAATSEISRNVGEAAQGTRDVSENVSRVLVSSSETGSAATQVLTAAAELATQSLSFKQEVDGFLREIQAA